MYLFHVLLLVFLELVTGLAIDDVAPRNSTMRVFKRNGMSVTVFEHAETGSTMEYISNSGICENTPNVKQYSGYLSVGQNMNMWFWFFEARNNPETAPLAAWFNGGPGCSSMIGLFQENGPCTYNNGEAAGSPSHNKHSWNEYANMLYIDQPIGVGFSYGSSNVSSSKDAAPLVWNLIQAFYSQFPQYKSREFGIWSESYGGHYGPAFGKYIIDQNAAIAKGNVKGQRINLTAIGLNNAWINPLDNYRGQIDYSLSNGYKQIITAAQAKSRHQKLDQICRPALERCWKSDSNSDCSRALMSCKVQVEIPLVDAGDFSVYDVKERRNAKWPPQTYEKWLQTSAIQRMIGAKTKFVECPKSIHTKFIRTGDDSRNYQPVLEEIMRHNITTLIWAGDTDWICNWKANLYTAENLMHPAKPQFLAEKMVPYKVNGKTMGEYKTAGKLSFLRVYGAGHTVMSYQPDISLQVFIQTMKKNAITST